jgi:hypothetical protein
MKARFFTNSPRQRSIAARSSSPAGATATAWPLIWIERWSSIREKQTAMRRFSARFSAVVAPVASGTKTVTS